jgi:hypothetical protein
MSLAQVLSRTVEGAKTGFLYGACYAIAGIVLLVIRGPRPFETAFGVSAPFAIILYLLAGVLAGAVVGILSPIGRSLVGKVFVGIVAMLPVSLMYIAVREEGLRFQSMLTGAFIISLLLGTLGGMVVWNNRR